MDFPSWTEWWIVLHVSVFDVYTYNHLIISLFHLLKLYVSTCKCHCLIRISFFICLIVFYEDKWSIWLSWMFLREWTYWTLSRFNLACEGTFMHFVSVHLFYGLLGGWKVLPYKKIYIEQRRSNQIIKQVCMPLITKFVGIKWVYREFKVVTRMDQINLIKKVGKLSGPNCLWSTRHNFCGNNRKCEVLFIHWKVVDVQNA